MSGMKNDFNIRPMEEKDKAAVTAMMRLFYASPALITHGSEEIFRRNAAACVSGSPFIEGFILETQGKTAGYAMLAHSFSTEFGRPCVWIEDLYVQPPFRGLGLGSLFISFVKEKFPDSLIRLEVERGNDDALHVYQKNGMTELPYREMIYVSDADEEDSARDEKKRCDG